MRLVGAALAGMLVTGAATSPAIADDRGGKNDGYVDVYVYKHKDNGKDKKVERSNLHVKDAAKYAAKKCDVKKWEWLLDEAKHADKHGKAYACTYHKNKNTKVYVWFEDNHKDKDHDKDKDKDHDKGKDKDKDKDKKDDKK